MDIHKLDQQLSKSETCPVLKANVLDVFSKMGLMELPEVLGDAVKFGINLHKKLEPSDFYISTSEKICEQFKIGDKNAKELFDLLDQSAVIYCQYVLMAFVLPDISNEISKLATIERASKKLRNLLPSPESDLFGLIKTADIIEAKNVESENTEKFFNQLNEYLLVLENLKTEISKSAFGQLTKIGSKSPKGNVAIRVWIISLYSIWENTLGRSLEFDGVEGVNGLSRFIDFAFETLLPIHQMIEHSQIEYAVRAFRNQPDSTHELLKPKKPPSIS